MERILEPFLKLEDHMEDLFEAIIDFILNLWEELTPKKLTQWFRKQKKIVRYILGPIYYALPLILIVLIIGIIIFLVIGIITLIQVLWKKYF